MSAATIATYGPIVIAVVLVVPVALFLLAMLFEGKFASRWDAIRKARRDAADSAPLELSARRADAHHHRITAFDDVLQVRMGPRLVFDVTLPAELAPIRAQR